MEYYSELGVVVLVDLKYFLLSSICWRGGAVSTVTDQKSMVSVIYAERVHLLSGSEPRRMPKSSAGRRRRGKSSKSNRKVQDH